MTQRGWSETPLYYRDGQGKAVTYCALSFVTHLKIISTLKKKDSAHLICYRIAENLIPPASLISLYYLTGIMCLISRDHISVLFQKFLYPVASLALLCTPLSVYAIVSMEDMHLGTPPQGFAGSFALDLALDSGNTEQQGAASGAKFQWTEGKVTDFILMNYEYGETSGFKNKNNGFVHYRHIEQRDVKYAWEGFAQGSYNEFTNLKLRALLGGGIRLTLGERNDKRAFLLGLGAFYEREKLDTIYPDEANTENKVRASSYLVIKFHFNEHVSLVNSTYYQPDLSEAGDFRVIEDLTLVSKLSEGTSLKVGVDIAYDSEPPRDIKQTDSSLKVGIVVNF